jgi:DNA-binding NarL/FixJ family response regulator
VPARRFTSIAKSSQSGRWRSMKKGMNGQSLRILLADACSIYRRGLRSLIETTIAHAEVFEASSFSEALSLNKTERYNLILADFEISRFQSFGPIRTASDSSSSTRWAIISATDTRTNILASLTAGFHGFISKKQSEDQVVNAINDLLSGRIYVPSSLADIDIGDGSTPSFNDDTPDILGGSECLTLSARQMLSARQQEVLHLLARGMSNKEIAHSLNIAESTSKIHTAAVLRALGVRNRTEAVIKALMISKYPPPEA